MATLLWTMFSPQKNVRPSVKNAGEWWTNLILHIIRKPFLKLGIAKLVKNVAVSLDK